MRKGVVIGCAGVVAAAAVAIGVYVQPATPIAVSSEPAAAPVVSSRSPSKAGVKVAVRPARADIAAAEPAGTLPAAYRILLKRSIFCPHAVSTAAGVNSLESTLALRGIVQERVGFIAFIENTASGEACKVKLGDAVGRGRVTKIDLHSVEFLTGKRATRVAVGQTFDGQSSSAATSSPALAAVHPQLD
jgi:hypothetical protein